MWAHPTRKHGSGAVLPRNGVSNLVVSSFRYGCLAVKVVQVGLDGLELALDEDFNFLGVGEGLPDVGVDALTDEREQHIRVSHPGTLPDYRSELVETLAEPDLVRPSDRDHRGLRFSKWFDSIRTGRYFVVVTISDSDPTRHWIITAYTARKLAGGS